MDLSALYIAERSHAVFHSVDRHVGISGSVLQHGLEYSSRSREEACATLFAVVHIGFGGYVLCIKPFCQLLVGKYGVDDSPVMLCFVFFCNTGTDKYRFCVRMTFFERRAMRLHRREHVGEEWKLGGEVLLYQKVYRVAAGAYHDIAVFLGKKSIVFFLYDGSAEGGLLYVGKAELFESLSHAVYADPGVVCDE